MSKKVYVGLSGGVDSSVSAHLLKEAGYDVTGVFIKVWQPDFIPCTWKEDRLDAMRVAAILDIPFRTLNLEKVYKKEVIDYLIAEYRAGRTPNPDVFCNKEVKFGAFLDWALKEGADFVATGHYAQVETQNLKYITYNLKKGEDKDKDQSYFLWTLKQEQLKHILFPVGHLEKKDVRMIASKIGLPTATKKDSQGLCFISNLDMKDFLKHFISSKEGEVLDESGEVIGSHDGAFLFTVGERHGFTVSKKDTSSEPYYVIHKDIQKNTVTVSNKTKAQNLKPKTYNLEHIKLREEIKGDIKAQVRYHGEIYSCRVSGSQVTFEIPILVSPGQSVVFYKNNICLGGGIIS